MQQNPPARIRQRAVPALSAAVLSAALILSPGYVQAAANFSDVAANYWAYSYISSLSSKGIINGYGSRFAPEQPVTRAEFAKMLVKALNLPTTHPAAPSYTDVSPDSWAYEYVETALQKKILNGVGDGRFAPNSQISRQDMAKMVSSSLPVEWSSVNASIRSSISFKDRDSIAPYAKEHVAVSSYLGLVNGIEQNYVPNGSATRAQAAAIIDRYLNLSPDKIASLTANLALSVVPQAASVTAGQTAVLAVQIRNNGNLLTSDNGRPVTLTIDYPTANPVSDNYAARSSRLEAVTHNGVAEFALPVTKAGTYTMEAVSSGLPAISSTFSVKAANAEKLYVSASPSPFLLPGSTAGITVMAVDRYNNPAPTAGSIQVSVSVSGSGQGILEKTSVTLQDGKASLGAFKACMVPGEVTLSAAAGSSLAGDTYKLTVMKNKAELISGKGIWMMWRDWYNRPNSTIIAEAKKHGINHIYLHIATTQDGIFSLDALDDFLQEAHRNGIKVLGWVYSDLRNPSQDAAQDIRVANYQTPSGDRVDALVTDIEDAQGTTEPNVNTYAQSVRAALGNVYPFFANTYPPSSRPYYPWKSFGTYFDGIIPMDYWHIKSKAYTEAEAYQYVKQSIEDIRRLTGKADIPIAIIGQGYDVFAEGNGPNNPQPFEVNGAMRAAKDMGAVGFSMYRWGTMTAGQWDVVGSFNW